MINYENLVNVNRVATITKGIGEFMMMKTSQIENLLVTPYFILNLTSEQFFKLQCKLEIPELNTWYVPVKGKLIESERQIDIDRSESLYRMSVAGTGSILENTHITLNGIFALYADSQAYTILQQDRIGMIESPAEFSRRGSKVVIDRLHVLSVADEKYLKNPYINSIEGAIKNESH